MADSALYSSGSLLAANDYLWLTRVPETIAEAREYLSQDDDAIVRQAGEDGYKYAERLSVHGNVPQRWLVVYSEQAYAREKKTLEQNLAKEYPLYRFQSQLVPVKKYARKGKPAAGDEPALVGYTLDLVLERNEEAMHALLNKKGRFILATNDMDAEGFPAARMLAEYKTQQGMERGFRFLKDPWFMVDSVFLKSPRRIEALMMVMALCLLVYNVAQYRLRDKLRNNGRDIAQPVEQGSAKPDPTVDISNHGGVGHCPDRGGYGHGQRDARVCDEHDVGSTKNHLLIRTHRLSHARAKSGQCDLGCRNVG